MLRSAQSLKNAVFFTKCLKVSKDQLASPLSYFYTSPFGTSANFKRSQLYGPTRSLRAVDIKTTGRSGTSESRSLSKLFDFSSSSMSSLARANKTRQIPAMALNAGKQSLPEPWVMIPDVEGRLDRRQVI
jgi:hypothetical protein